MVVVRDATEGDVNAIARVMKEFFTVHNVFSKSGDDVCSYLSSQMKERPLLVAEKDGEIKGAMFLVRKGGDGNHALWKYRHAVFSGHQVACALFTEAEKRIRAQSKTAKIENTLAETERSVDEYALQGYVHEATLHDHYRLGESCLVYSKTLSDTGDKDAPIEEENHCACGDGSLNQDCCGK